MQSLSLIGRYVLCCCLAAAKARISWMETCSPVAVTSSHQTICCLLPSMDNGTMTNNVWIVDTIKDLKNVTPDLWCSWCSSPNSNFLTSNRSMRYLPRILRMHFQFAFLWRPTHNTPMHPRGRVLLANWHPENSTTVLACQASPLAEWTVSITLNSYDFSELEWLKQTHLLP